VIREVRPPLGPRLGETAVQIFGEGVFNFNGQVCQSSPTAF
jgi:hypothetical protein